MPVISWSASVAPRKAFQASLSQLVQMGRIPQNFQILPNPLPLYHVDLRDVLTTTDASVSAKMVGWRYVANGDSQDTVIAGDINLSSPPRVVRLSYGSPVWGALKVASGPHPDVPRMDECHYEPRLLRVPGLYIEAYWMKMLAPTAEGEETGWVIPHHALQREEEPRPAKMYPMKEFSRQLQRHAGVQLNRSNRAGEAR